MLLHHTNFRGYSFLSFNKALTLATLIFICGINAIVKASSNEENTDAQVCQTRVVEDICINRIEELNKVVVNPQTAPENALCKDIGVQNLSTLPRVTDPSMGDSIQDPYAFYTFLTETIFNPQPHDKRKRAFKILACAEHDKNAAWTSQTLLDKTTWQDLNLVSGSKENPAIYLASTLSEGRTHTELGKAYLCGMLARPTTDVVLLEKRQQVTKKLIEDEKLFNALDSLLQEVAPSETLFTGLWDTELLMQFLQSGYSKLDGIGPAINQSSTCLEIASLVNLCKNCIGTGITTISPIVLTLYGLSMLYQGSADACLDDLRDPCLGQAGLIFKAFPILKNRWAQGVVALGVGAVAALSVKQMIQGMHTHFLFDDFLRKRLVYVAMYTQAAHGIASTLTNNVPEFAESLTFFNDITGFFGEQMNNDPELAKLDSLLKTDTFEKGSEKEFTLFFRRGNMLAAYYMLNTSKQKFETMMTGIGELDAFLTIAKLVKESENAKTKFCFPSYLKNATNPSIQLADFWNPFIDQKTVVLNTLNLGIKHNVPNIVVTGPNSAGKSTILKSIALAIIFAQSLGIAPAKTMAITPFSYLTTYMNIADSIIDQESRFQAEARRVFEYGDKLEGLAKNNQFSFALFDEIFSGTSPLEGAELGYRVATILSSYSNCISIIASHFEKLTHLEKDTNKKFINYKVAVAENDNGSIYFDENNKIKRMFTLTPGISSQHIAREVFKEKGTSKQSHFFEKCFNHPNNTLVN